MSDPPPQDGGGAPPDDGAIAEGLPTHAIVVIVVAVVLVLLTIICNIWASGGKNKYFPSLEGKIIVITGANTGLGYETAVEMVKLNPKMIVFACRDQTRALNAIEKLRTATGLGADNVEFMPLDLDDLESVKKFADDFNAKYDKLDILLNNAGIMALPEKQTTKQGYERQNGVNHVGHFLLTTLLLDKVKAADQARIVNVSSLAHENAPMHLDDYHWDKNKYDPWPVYQQSKLSNVYFTRQMNTNFQKEGVTNVKVVSLHPGVVRTELGRYSVGASMCQTFIFKYICGCCYYSCTKNSVQGAQTQLHCCLIDWDKLESGSYYSDCAIKKEKFKNKEGWPQEAEKLWALSEEMVKDYR